MRGVVSLRYVLQHSRRVCSVRMRSEHWSALASPHCTMMSSAASRVSCVFSQRTLARTRVRPGSYRVAAQAILVGASASMGSSVAGLRRLG